MDHTNSSNMIYCELYLRAPTTMAAAWQAFYTKLMMGSGGVYVILKTNKPSSSNCSVIT